MFDFQKYHYLSAPLLSCKWSRNEVGEYIGINPFHFTEATFFGGMLGQMQLNLRLPNSGVDDDDSQTLEIIEKAIKSLLDLVLNNALGDTVDDTLYDARDDALGDIQ